MPHPHRRRRGPKPYRRRALELLAASPEGCTEARKSVREPLGRRTPLARRASMERHANGEAQFSICVRRAKRAREAAEKKQVTDPAEIASIRAAADLRLADGHGHMALSAGHA
jgi:hypothetical protein